MNYKAISKITIYSIVMSIFAILGIVCFIYSLPGLSKYGFDSLMDPIVFNKDALMPVSMQEIRAWSVASLIICTFLISLNIREIKRLENVYYRKYFIASLGIFTWMLLPYTLYIGIKNQLYSKYFEYISQDKNEKLQISLCSIKNGFLNKGKKDKLFWNTIFGLLVFLITTIGIVFCSLIAENLYGVETIHKVTQNELNPLWTPNDYYNYSETTSLFTTFMFFTQLTNILCFVFMFAFMFFNKKIIFKNNTIMIGTSSYIFIVSVVFWVYLFPLSLAKNGYYDIPFIFAKTIWLHAVTPIFFIIFFFTNMFISKHEPNKFKKIIGVSLIYPALYGIFIYTLPFYTRINAYGPLTNLNPYMSPTIGMIDKNGDALVNVGSPFAILWLAGLIIVFILIIFAFWSVPYLIHKNTLKKSKNQIIN